VEVSSSVTQLLREIRAGEGGCAYPAAIMDQLFPLVYAELRRLADACIRRERPGHTLQATALVHEAYLRLCGGALPDYRDRAHFMGIAGRIMRQILVDYARRRNSQKRGAALQAPLDEARMASKDRPAAMIELDDALNDLEKRDERKARLIEMRFFGGLTAEESAEALHIDVAAARRELRLAQAWLERELDRRSPALF
jgi:RNA polymerase sigma factor (TIGR02999 family)